MEYLASQFKIIDYFKEFKSWDEELSSAGIFRRKSNLNDPLKRVHLVGKHYLWSPSEADRPIIEKSRSKSADIASRLREDGNKFFEEKKWRDAHRLYSLAVLYAPECDEQLGLSYGNRSAVLVQMDYPEEALRDIELALASNYPEAKKSKLEQRRIKCLKMIDGEGDDEFETHAKGAAKKELVRFRKFREKMLRIESPNPKMPSAADFVEVKFDKERGRYLVTNKDLSPGTVVIVEKPVVKILAKETRWHIFHCNYCIKRINRGIPCKSCVVALYCDEDCRGKAYEEFHQYECPCMPYLHGGSFQQPTLLAFRLITQMGPAELLRLFESKDPKYFKPCENPRAFGTDPDCDYESNPYTAVYQYLAHSDKLSSVDKRWHTFQALLLTTVLESCSTFFDGVPREKAKKFKNFVAALMTHHMESFQANACDIWEMTGFEDVPLKEMFRLNDFTSDMKVKLARPRDRLPIATGMYPVHSLANHSCDPSTFRLFDGINGTLLVVTNRSVKAGEEITACYINPFYTMPLDTCARQLSLGGYFVCDCLPCKYNYPTLDGLLSKDRVPIVTKVTFCCPSCSPQFMEKDKMSKDFERCILSPDNPKCHRCGKQYSKKTLLEELSKNDSSLDRGKRLVADGRLREAIEYLMAPIEYYRLNVVPPYSYKYFIELLFFDAMTILFRYAQ